LHVTARYLDKDGKVDLKKGNYHEFPAEEWLVLSREEAERLVPPDRAPVEVDPALATKLLSRLYPLTGNFSGPATNTIAEGSLTARIVAVGKGALWVRLDGRVTMDHPFFPDRDPRRIESTFTGYVTVDAATRAVRSVRIATERGTYGKESFGVAIRSDP
ncbi:MAG TPA: hypothetical protein VJB14_12625, partial [Planctomycetota bacterium]|nr:hypothetical protein [Planctomycetota bacterium]